MTRQSITLVPDVDPAAVALVTPERSLTWNELEQRARMLANALVGAGVGPGSVWAVLLHNRAEWAEVLMGNARAGSRYVPLNWHLTPRELAELLVDSGAAVLVTEPSLVEAAREAAARACVDRVIVVGEEYETWLADVGDEPPLEGPVGSPLQYTGGTTGRSKGVTRADMSGTASDWRRLLGGWARLVRMPEHGVTLSSTPLSASR